MSLTRQQWGKHKEAIKWFYEQPRGTKIWKRWKFNENWELISNPSWLVDNIYIINDEYAELRKAIADGVEVEFFDINNNKEWVSLKTFTNGCDPNRKFLSDVYYYRIKPEIKFPIYKKNDFMIVKFTSKDTFEILFIFNKEIFKECDIEGSVSSIITLHQKNKFLNFANWQDIVYDEERGFWDGQPVWAWDNITKVGRCLEFYNAKYKTVFDDDGKRGDYDYDNYEPYPYLEDDWIVEAYNKLKFD